MKRRIRMGMGRSMLATVLIVIVLLGTGISLILYQYQNPDSNACSKPAPSPYITEYCAINKSSSPNAIAVDAQGNVWFIAQNESDLCVLYASNSTIRTFHVPTAPNITAQSWGIAVDNSRNLVWFTDYASNAIWSFDITTRQFTSYNITTSSFAEPEQLVLDPQGNVWFTEYANYIGEITTTGQENNYRLPSELTKISYAGPFGLTIDSNSTLWFSDPDANSIGSFNLSSHTFQVYNMTGMATSPVGIAVDSHGNVWMTQHGPSLISEFNPKTGFFRSITTFIPVYLQASLPYFLYIDSQGNVWFNEHYGNTIGRFSPSNSTLVEYVIPTKIVSAGNISGAITMTLAPNGTPWFTEWYAGKIGKVNLAAPINIGFSFQNSSANEGAPLSLSSNRNLTLALDAFSPSNETVTLSAFLSTYNYSEPYLFSSTANNLNKTEPAFIYTFSSSSESRGNFTSVLNIQDQLLSGGTYYLTISEIANNIHFSRVIQIVVP